MAAYLSSFGCINFLCPSFVPARADRTVHLLRDARLPVNFRNSANLSGLVLACTWFRRTELGVLMEREVRHGRRKFTREFKLEAVRLIKERCV